jgi:hypothetical protein
MAATACTSGTLDSYIQTTGANYLCTLSQFTVSDVFFQVGATNLSTTAQASALTINVVPTITHLTAGDSLALAFSSTLFSVGNGSFVNYEIRYNVDPPPDIIIEMGDDLNTNTPHAPGFAHIDTNVCIGGKWVQPTSGALFCDTPGTVSTLHVFHNGDVTGNQLIDLVTFPGVHVLGVDNLIDLDAMGGAGATSSITGVTNVLFATPEPATAGLAFAALALMASRRLRGKVG